LKWVLLWKRQQDETPSGEEKKLQFLLMLGGGAFSLKAFNYIKTLQAFDEETLEEESLKIELNKQQTFLNVQRVFIHILTSSHI
jgi:hypothetical protein